MKALLGVLAVVVLLVLVVGGSLMGSRNELVTEKNMVDGAWAQVDVALQRRADLIPNLVESVKGFAAQEKAVIQSVADARAALGGARTPAEKIAANSQIDSALSRLLVVVENYPNLKSNENFLRLQDELAGTENRIAVERQRYNETVRDYNTAVRQFPASLVASLRGIKTDFAYFEAPKEAQTAPKVDFSKPAT
jgi:LemA protein